MLGFAKKLRRSRCLHTGRVQPLTGYFVALLFIPQWLVAQPLNLAFWEKTMSCTGLDVKNHIFETP